MNRLYLLLIFLFCCCHTYAQSSSLKNADFPACAGGLYTGYTNTVAAELFGPTDNYSTMLIGGSFVVRPLRHMQLGLNFDHSVSNQLWTTALSMTFPIGKNRSYFYPGWHLLIMNSDGQPFIGIGAILGGNIALNHWLSLNLQSDASILFLGSRLSFCSGLIAKF